MVNIQLVDTFDGGHLLFTRNDYPLDEGVYSEIYACMFATSSPNWWGDTAFGVQSEQVASRTENAIKTHSALRQDDINLIRKAVNDDLTRLVKKNPEISITRSAVLVYGNRGLEIIVEVSGYSDTFNFIWQKTKQSLENVDYKMYINEAVITGLVTAGSNTIGAGSTNVTASGRLL